MEQMIKPAVGIPVLHEAPEHLAGDLPRRIRESRVSAAPALQVLRPEVE